MNISLRWLQSLAPSITGTPQEIADRLARYGAPADDVVELGAQIGDVVIARVLEARRHPNADRLSLCTVDAGTGTPLSVVCGAPNVRAGGVYPFAPVGSSLPNDVTIRKAKIRGETSEGMLCSARELGLGREQDGILELHGDFTPGERFAPTLGLDDVRFVIDVSPNRGDQLSHIGIARELAEDGRVALPAFPNSGAVKLELKSDGASVAVRIDDPDLCPRYAGAIIRGVKVGPSPAWLDARLRAIGARPINNVVDATNYLLHEVGQPMHAFDLDRLGNQVVIRTARAGERVTTLDDVDRKLSDGMLVIADANKPVALAGLMGGADTEVTSSTTNVFLECALFEPKQIRRTRNALGMSTDASYRFERGVDPEGIETALKRAVELIIAIAGGTAEPVAVDVGARPEPRRELRVRTARTAQLLGEEFTVDAMARLLAPIGFEITDRAPAELGVRVPGFRSYDVVREVDVIEEVARRHGYDNFSEELRPFRPSAVPDDAGFQLQDRLRDLFVGLGFLETRSVAFVGERDGDVALLLPLASNESRLRRTVLTSVLRRVEWNWARATADIRLFELGTAFSPGEPNGLPVETTRLAVAFTGARTPAHWTGGNASFDVWDLSGLLDRLGSHLGCEVRAGASPGLSGVDALLTTPAFHLIRGDTVIGHGGLVASGALDAPAWAQPVWAIEVLLVPDPAERPNVQYAPVPTTPAIERDLALLAPQPLPASAIEQTIARSAGSLLERVHAFDVYEGKGIEPGLRSVAFRLRYRATDRTLTDAEVDTSIERVLKALQEEHGIRRR